MEWWPIALCWLEHPDQLSGGSQDHALLDPQKNQAVTLICSCFFLLHGMVAYTDRLYLRIDYEYARKGMCNIFMVNEPLNGQQRVKITEKKTKVDWAILLKEIADEDYTNAEKITLVMDNFKTHSPGAFYEAFEPKEAKRIWDKFEFVFTPKHGSWLNMAEIELNVLSNQCLNRRIDNMEEIIAETKAWAIHRNNKDAKINWQFTTKDSRIKLKRLYPSI
jgi:transposase